MCSTSIKSIAFFNHLNSQVVISSADLCTQIITIAPKIDVLDKAGTPGKRRNKKKTDIPDLLAISPNDKHLLSVEKNGTIQVKAVSEEETKDELNWSVQQEKVTAIAFISDDLLASASTD